MLCVGVSVEIVIPVKFMLNLIEYETSENLYGANSRMVRFKKFFNAILF
jgi:hypothetical protein